MSLVTALVDGLVDTTVVRPSGGGGSGWTPADISPTMWVETGDIGDFYQDQAKTTAVTANGDPVGAWVDKSGNGNDFTNSIAADRPEYQTTFVRGDGTTERVISPNWVPTDTHLWGIRFTRQDSSNNQGIVSQASTAISGSPGWLVNTLNATTVQVYVDGGYRFSFAAGVGDSVSLVLRVTKPASHQLVDCWVNGVKQTQYNGGTALASLLTNPWYLISGFQTAGQHDVSCFVLAQGAFTDTDATDLSTYLDSK